MLVALVIGISFSCSKDLGNYDYHDINEVDVNFDSTSYSLMQGMPIKIVPKISFTMDESGDTANYSYRWQAHRIVSNKDEFTTVGTERNLEAPYLALSPDDYTLFYKVTDKNTGVTWTSECALKVRTSIYEGWLALCDDNGKSRLDMVSIIDGSPVVMNDVLTRVGSNIPSSYTDAAPIEVQSFGSGKGFYGIYIMTEGGATRIEEETFMWDETYDIINEFDAEPQSGFVPSHISYVTGYEMYLHDTNGNAYFYSRTAQANYALPISTLDLKDFFKVSKYVASNTFSMYPTYLYDETNQRFIRHYKGMTQLNKSSKITNGNKLTSWNTGKDLVYMDKQGGARDGDVTAILKDPADSKFYVLRFAGAGTPTQKKYEELDINNFEGISSFDDIEHYAVHNSLPYLFYNKGGKVYEYDMELKQSFLMLDLGSKEITILDFADQTYMAKYYDKLQICSYDSSTENSGTMEFFSVGPVNGPLTSTEKHEGLGKIVSTDYRVR